MTIETAYVGEDVPIHVDFENENGSLVDPDDQDSDGDADASIAISYDGAEVVTDAEMTKLETGRFEYVWDTSAESTGVHQVEVSAEFSGNTKITKDQITLR